MTVTLAQRRSEGLEERVESTAPTMNKFVIDGGVPLSGTVVPAGNKNAALPILAASVLTADEVVIRNVPRIRDVAAMLELLELLGVTVEQRSEHEVVLCAKGVTADALVDDAWPSRSGRPSCSRARCSRASAVLTCRRRAVT